MHLHNAPLRRFNGPHVVAVFDNPGAFLVSLDGMAGKATTQQQMSADRNGRFYSGETWQTMQTRAVEGDAETAKRAAAVMSKIARVPYDTPKRKRVASPYGRVSVGAYLASGPMPCRRHVKQASPHAPVSIVVSLNSLAKVKADSLEKRGVAIAALVRRLTTERPVNLYLSRFSVARDAASCLLVKFPTAPLDSYRLAYLLSSQGFARGAGFAFHRSAQEIYAAAGAGKVNDVRDTNYIAFAGPSGYSQTRNCNYARDLGEFLNTDLLYVPGSDPDNKDFNQMVNDPVAWVNETMAELTKPATMAKPA